MPKKKKTLKTLKYDEICRKMQKNMHFCLKYARHATSNGAQNVGNFMNRKDLKIYPIIIIAEKHAIS